MYIKKEVKIVFYGDKNQSSDRHWFIFASNKNEELFYQIKQYIDDRIEEILSSINVNVENSIAIEEMSDTIRKTIIDALKKTRA